jgi:hypothetical protein
MKTLLWLDDTRDCFEDNGKWLVFSPIPVDELTKVVWVKSYNEFVDYITDYGVPDGICFDVDLDFNHYGISQEKWLDYIKSERPLWEMTGYDCTLYLIEYCRDNKCPLPLWNCQSANPIGKENINSVMNNFKKYQDESNY